MKFMRILDGEKLLTVISLDNVAMLDDVGGKTRIKYHGTVKDLLVPVPIEKVWEHLEEDQ